MVDEILIEAQNIIKKALRTNPPQRHLGNECVLVPLNDFNRFRAAVRKFDNIQINHPIEDEDQIPDSVFELPTFAANEEFFMELERDDF